MINSKKDELIHFYESKANEALSDASLLASNESWNGTANRLYYACFFIVYAALINKIDIRIKSHSGIKTLFNQHFIKSSLISIKYSKLYSYLFDLRGDADYGDFIVFTKEEIMPLISETKDFISVVKATIK